MHKKLASPALRAERSVNPFSLSGKVVSCFVSLILMFNPAFSNAGVVVDGVVDGGGSGQASVSVAGNGVPVIDIAVPTASGVSHNRFSQFDIEQQGLILNNSRSLVDTQLAGRIHANSNLTGAAAAIILNEVTSTQRSHLNGLAEIAGRPAEFVLANPNGISCSGCGFINTPRATLTTGVPSLLGGALQGFVVGGGDIAVETLNASSIDRLDIFARAITLNQKLHAKQLNLITGRNDIAYSDLSLNIKTDDGSARPTFALDVAALGGMYANQIYMVGTEVGLGVNMQGEMATQTGDITLNADGTLSINKIVSGAALELHSVEGDVEISGNTYSKTHTRVVADKGDVVNRGNLIAEAGLLISANNLLNAPSGKIQSFGVTDIQLGGEFHNQAEGAAQGAVTSDGLFSVAADNIFNNGLLGGGAKVSLTARNRIENCASYGRPGAVLFAVGDLGLYGQYILNRQSEIFSLGNMAVAGDVLNNAARLVRNSSATLESFGSLSLKSDEFVNHRQGLYNLNNSHYCPVGTSCNYPITFASGYGFEDGTTRSAAWLVQAMDEFVALDWSDESDWDNPKQSLRTAYQVLVDRVLPSSRNAKILVGRDFNIEAGAFRNEGGFISATNSIAANVGTFTNISRVALMPGASTWPNHSEAWLNKFDYETDWPDYETHYLFFEGAITAGNTIAVTAATLISNGNSSEGSSAPQVVPDTPLPRSPSSGTAAVGIVEQLNLAVNNPFASFLDLPPGADFDRVDVTISLPPSTGGGLFSYADPVTGQTNTLIATHSSVARLVDVQGSDYLLNLLDFNPDNVTKRLGDGFYESRLIREAIFETTGNRFLHDSFVSDAQQYRYLMDGAARAQKDLQLTVGVTLTREQMEALTHDIVWMEEKEVNGQTVLVPTLYLAGVRENSVDHDGALLSAQNIVLNSGGEIVNGAGISAVNVLGMKAEGDVKNHGGNLEASRVVIASETGDFSHTAQNNKKAYLTAGSSLSIRVGRDIDIQGAEIYAGGSGRLKAGRDLKLVSTLGQSESKNTYSQDETNGVISQHSTAQRRNDAQLNVEGDSAITAGRDLSLEGAQLNVGGHAALDVGRDMSLLSVTNKTTTQVREKHTTFDSVEEGYHSARGPLGVDQRQQIAASIVSTTNRFTEQGSGLNVGRDLRLKAGGDVNLVASDVRVDGRADIAVDGGFSLRAKSDTELKSVSVRETFLRSVGDGAAPLPLGISQGNQSQSMHSQATALQQSYVLATAPTPKVSQNIRQFSEVSSTNSASTLNSRRSSVAVGGDINLLAAGAILNQESNFLGRDVRLTSRENIINSGGATILGDRLSLTATSDIINRRDVSETVARNGSFITTEVSAASEIKATEALDLKAGRDLINEGASIVSGGSGRLVAGRNIVVGAVVDRERRADDKNDIRDDTRHLGSKLKAKQNLGLSAEADIEVYGSDVSAGGNLLLQAGNGISVASVVDKHYRYVHDEDSSGFSRSSETTELFQTTNVASELQAEGDVTLLARDQDVIVRGSALSAGGDVTVYSGGSVKFEAVQEVYDYKHDSSSSSLAGLKSAEKSISHYKKGYATASSKSAGDTAVRSAGNIRIVAADIMSGGDVALESDGRIEFLTVKETDHYSYHKQVNGDVKMSVAGHGYYDEMVKQVEVKAEGALTLDSAQGIFANFHQQAGETLQQSIARLGRSNPNLSWMAVLSERDDVDWSGIQEVHERWDYQHTGLSQMGALVLQVVVSAALPGAGVASVNGMFGAGTVGLNTATAAAVNTGFNTMVSMASSSLIANGGDLGATLEELGSSSSVRHLLVSSLSAGVGLTPAPATQLSTGDVLGRSLAALNPEGQKLANFVMSSWNESWKAIGNNLIGETMQFYARKEIAGHARRLGLSAEELNVVLMLNSYAGKRIAGTSYLRGGGANGNKKVVYGFLSRSQGLLGESGGVIGGVWDINDSILNSQGYIDAVAASAALENEGSLIGHSLGAWRVNNLVRSGLIQEGEVLALPLFDFPVAGVKNTCAEFDAICGGDIFNFIRPGSISTSNPGGFGLLKIFTENHTISTVPGYLEGIKTYYEN